jgi:hypothetical protein
MVRPDATTAAKMSREVRDGAPVNLAEVDGLRRRPCCEVLDG